MKKDVGILDIGRIVNNPVGVMHVGPLQSVRNGYGIGIVPLKAGELYSVIEKEPSVGMTDERRVVGEPIMLSSDDVRLLGRRRLQHHAQLLPGAIDIGGGHHADAYAVASPIRGRTPARVVTQHEEIIDFGDRRVVLSARVPRSRGRLPRP